SFRTSPCWEAARAASSADTAARNPTTTRPGATDAVETRGPLDRISAAPEGWASATGTASAPRTALTTMMDWSQTILLFNENPFVWGTEVGDGTGKSRNALQRFHHGGAVYVLSARASVSMRHRCS